MHFELPTSFAVLPVTISAAVEYLPVPAPVPTTINTTAIEPPDDAGGNGQPAPTKPK